MSETSAVGCPAFVRLVPSHDPTACLGQTFANTISKRCVWYQERINRFSNSYISKYSIMLLVVRVFGIATGYGLDGPGIESRWGARFPALVQTGPGAHPASCTLGTRSFPGVKSGRGVTLTPHPTSSAVGHERVELYLYSPYGPYGLYRASV